MWGPARPLRALIEPRASTVNGLDRCDVPTDGQLGASTSCPLAVHAPLSCGEVGLDEAGGRRKCGKRLRRSASRLTREASAETFTAATTVRFAARTGTAAERRPSSSS